MIVWDVTKDLAELRKVTPRKLKSVDHTQNGYRYVKFYKHLVCLEYRKFKLLGCYFHNLNLINIFIILSITHDFSKGFKC